MKTSLIKAEKILSPTQISLAQYTINPYRGCPFGCIYCYAQQNKAIKKKELPWGDFIDVKINCLELLEKEIHGKNINRVLLGSTVECYPPQEKKFFLTKGIIETLNRNCIAVTILTKSVLIKRDLQLLAKFKQNKIYLTINFESEATKRFFEPQSSTLKQRISLLKEIRILKINNRIHISPLIPYIQNIHRIYSMVAKYTDEISIELYNFRMGNWIKIKEIIRRNFGDKILAKIENVISYNKNYEEFVKELQAQIKELERISGKKIILIIPDLKDFYKSGVLYE
jgi:DNA repair photolyase